MVAKVKTYFQFGVRSCWVVQPAVQGIFVFDSPTHYRFFHGNDTLHDEILGTELPLDHCICLRLRPYLCQKNFPPPYVLHRRRTFPRIQGPHQAGRLHQRQRLHRLFRPG